MPTREASAAADAGSVSSASIRPRMGSRALTAAAGSAITSTSSMSPSSPLTSLFVKGRGYVGGMELLPLRRLRGIRQVGEGLGTLDREVFEAVAESPSPLLDATMPRLTRAADHSKLWLVIAALLAASGHRASRRGAVRGLVTLGATSLFTNQVAKRVWKRPRPNRLTVPLARRGHRTPTSNSLPSGPSSSA